MAVRRRGGLLRSTSSVVVGVAVALLMLRMGAQRTATANGTLIGRVLTPGGQRIGDLRISLVPEGERNATGASRTLSGSTSASFADTIHVTTDAHGAFVCLHLLAGSYRVFLALGVNEVIPIGSLQIHDGTPERVDIIASAQGARLLSSASASVSPESFPGAGAENNTFEGVEADDAVAQPAVAVNSSPGERADTPDENQAHTTSVPSPPTATVDVDETSASLADAGSIDDLSARQSFRNGTRGDAAGGPATGAVFARAAVRSLRDGARSYSAVEGNSASVSGGRLESRSGIGGTHGGLFATVRDSAFDAANPYAIVTRYQDGTISSGVAKPNETDVETGAHVGFAPLARWDRAGVWRERVFGFAALDARVRNAPIESTPATPSFYALTATQRALLGTRGVTVAQTNSALDYLDSLSGEIARHELRLLSFGRVDVRVSARDDVAFTFAGDHVRLPAGAAFDQLADAVVARGRGSVGDSGVDVQAYAGHWAHTFHSRIANTLHVQFVHDLESELPRAPLPQEPAISPGSEAPEVNIAPEGFVYGTSAQLDRIAYPDEHRLELADTFRAAAHAHIFTLGGSWSRIRDDVNSLQNANGTFLYDSDEANGHAGGLVDWITDATYNVHAYPNGGCPSITAAVHDFCFRTYTQSFGTAQTSFVTHEFDGFAEDAFFPRRDLRVALGVRYEYTLLPLPQVPNVGLDASLRVLALPAPLAGVTGAYPEDRNNAGPRFALAWAPQEGRRLTIHAGYGMFFGQPAGTTVRAALADNGLTNGIAQVRITPTTETLCPQVANQGFGYPCAFTAAPPSAVAQTSSISLFSSSFRLPNIQRLSLRVEHAFGKHVFAELGYTGAIATQLPTSVDINIAPSASIARYMLQGGTTAPGLTGGRVFAVPLYTARRLSNFGPVTAITSQANATYHAGSLSATVREWHGVEAHGSITFSRAIDDNPQSGPTLRLNGNFDPFAIGYDKGLSDTQSPLRFAGQLLLRPVLRRGPRWMEQGVNGFRIQAIATAASGLPYSYEIFGGTRLTGGYTSINGAGGATFLPTVGRNTLRLPTRTNVNLRLERGGTWHGVRMVGFAEAFNLLNTRNLSRVETRAFLPATAINGVTPLVFQDTATVAAEGITTPAFGTFTSSTSGVSRERLLALGVRVAF